MPLQTASRPRRKRPHRRRKAAPRPSGRRNLCGRRPSLPQGTGFLMHKKTPRPLVCGVFSGPSTGRAFFSRRGASAARCTAKIMLCAHEGRAFPAKGPVPTPSEGRRPSGCGEHPAFYGVRRTWGAVDVGRGEHPLFYQGMTKRRPVPRLSRRPPARAFPGKRAF